MATERLDIVISERGARRVSRDIAKIGTASRVAQGGVSLLRSALGGLAGALVLRGIVRVLAGFSQSMSTLKAITQTTGAEFDKLREKAKELGIQTRFSATQAADAMVFLARTGFTANQVLATIQGTLNLAQIGLIEVARAADIASNVLKGFKLNVSEMERVVDVLAITSVRANVTVESLGDAMSFAASAAAALGVSVEDTAAAIGVLGDRAIPGSRAGAGLNLVFAKMVVLTAAAKRALKEMGLGVEAVDIKSRGLIPVLESLADKNLTLKQAIGLVGVRQAKTLLIIADSVPRMKELSEEYASGAITALELSRIMDDNLNGALIRITSAAQGVILALGDIGTESLLRSGLEGLGALLRSIARNIQDVVEGFTVLAVGFAFTKITAAINLITVAVLRLNAAILRNPFGALATVIVVATAALVTFKDEVKLTEDGAVTFRDAWEGAGDALGDTFVTIMQDAGFEVVDFADIVQIATRAAAKAFVFMVAIINGALNTLPKATSRFELGIKSLAFLLNTQLNKALELVNEQLRGLGGDPIPLFNVKALGEEILKLKGGLVDADKSFSLLFAEGFNAVDDAIARSAEQRKLLAFFEKNVRRKPEREIVEDADKDKGKTGKPKLEPIAFRNLIRDLKRENTLLGLNNEARQIQEALFAAADAREKDLNKTQKETITNLVLLNVSLTKQRELLDTINGPAESYASTLKELDTLLGNVKISQQEFNVALRDAKIEFLDTQKDIVSGVERAFLKMGRDSEDLASQIESTITNAFKGAGDALHDFVTTGKLDFTSLINSIISDLARLAIKGAIIGPLSKFIGGEDTGIGDEDPTKGLQGLFERFFGSGDPGPGPLPDAGGFAESLDVAGGFGVDIAATEMSAAAGAMTVAMTTAAPAIQAVTTAALPAGTALGTVATTAAEVTVSNTAQTLTSEQLIASLGQLAIVSDAATAALQRIALSGGGLGETGTGGLQGVFDAIFPGSGGPGPLPDAGGFAESIPGFKHGGQVPGDPGAVPIMAHAGEVILNKAQQKGLLQALSGAQTGENPLAAFDLNKFGSFGGLLGGIISAFGLGGGAGRNPNVGRNALSGPIALGPDTALNPGFNQARNSGLDGIFGDGGFAGILGGFAKLILNDGAGLKALQANQAPVPQVPPPSFAHGGVVGPSSASFTPPTSAGKRSGGNGDSDESIQVINQTWNIETQDVGGFNRTRHQIMGQAAGGVGSVRGRG